MGKKNARRRAGNYQPGWSGILRTYPDVYIWPGPAIDYILYDGGEPVGHARTLWPGEDDVSEPVNLHLINIYDENKRGRGYGSALMSKFLDDVDRAGKKVILYVEGHGNTKDAFIRYVNRNVRFYERFGFVLNDPSWADRFGWTGPFMTRPARACT